MRNNMCIFKHLKIVVKIVVNCVQLMVNREKVMIY